MPIETQIKIRNTIRTRKDSEMHKMFWLKSLNMQIILKKQIKNTHKIKNPTKERIKRMNT